MPLRVILVGQKTPDRFLLWLNLQWLVGGFEDPSHSAGVVAWTVGSSSVIRIRWTGEGKLWEENGYQSCREYRRTCELLRSPASKSSRSQSTNSVDFGPTSKPRHRCCGAWARRESERAVFGTAGHWCLRRGSGRRQWTGSGRSRRDLPVSTLRTSAVARGRRMPEGESFTPTNVAPPGRQGA